MLMWPDWNKLYANWQCLYFWVPFSDEQRKLLNQANEVKKNELIRKWREEYLSNRDVITGELKKPAKEQAVEPEVVEEKAEEVSEVEESIEDVKPAKPTKKKGK